MAAGQSVRFGSDKLLADWRGRPVFAHTLANLPVDLLERIVVVAHTPRILAAARERGFVTVLNERPQDGPGRTIRLGLDRLPDMDACMFTVCDQPELQPNSLRRLICSYEGGIRALAFDGRRGSPVIFPAALFHELRRLPDSRGGSDVIRSHPDMLELCECGCIRELLDVDTPAQFEALTRLEHLLIEGPHSQAMLDAALAMLPQALAAGLQEDPCGPAAAAYDETCGSVRRAGASEGTLVLWSGDIGISDICDRLMQIAVSRKAEAGKPWFAASGNEG